MRLFIGDQEQTKPYLSPFPR